MELRCSFCNKTQHDVQTLIAGPSVYICNECVDICLDVISEKRKDEFFAPAPIAPAGRCALCALPAPPEHALFIDDARGALCVGCVDAIEGAKAAALPPHSES